MKELIGETFVVGVFFGLGLCVAVGITKVVLILLAAVTG